ncbi:YgiQ family radical SAM protein [Lachnobacterium bovis]|uniref:YgiQ family radical SAM protein n=1 Tax=Lachnobacterium bovis TaxID=140626 RepID=UPI0009DE9CEC|nr:YgiQ family radical SAM protein [Lachnobacterium bovis]
MSKGYLPICKKDMIEAGISQFDFIYISGDAYVDHSSFGSAIICRLLEAHGYKVGMICQPDWKNPESIMEYGEPKYSFMVSAGNMDSMVNHYTVNKKHRSKDSYSPGGVMGKRPDYAVIVYCNLIRQVYKHTPIIIGGIEASLRRMGHYDYWSNKVRRSILLDSGADIISYGMGEHSIIEIADALASGIEIKDITFIDGTVYKTRKEEDIYDAIRLPDFEEIKSDKRKYAESFAIQYKNTDPFQAKRLYEAYDGKMFVVQNPPAKPLTEMEMDDTYDLPYMRNYHPIYEKDGGIPALNEIKFSLTSNRGCYGSCNFCALTFHEGRIIQARSHESILKEAKQCIEDPDFKGYIHDVGGPTAEFRKPACKKQTKFGACKNRHCLFPEPCPNLEVDHTDYIKLLRKVRNLEGVKKVFVRSGFRFDYLVADKNKEFLNELCKYHVSGQLRVAPEHISDNVLKRMGKPGVDIYNKFVKEFTQVNKKLKKDQYIVPYLMSSHPGSTLKDAIALAEYVRDLGYMPEQVQDFYPTPGTISTCMYYTKLDPLTMEEVYVATDPHEKAMQRALIQYRNPDNYDLVKEALIKEHREDLIGFGEECLIPPRKIKNFSDYHHKKKPDGKSKKPDGKSKKPDGKSKKIDGKVKKPDNKKSSGRKPSEKSAFFNKKNKGPKNSKRNKH